MALKIRRPDRRPDVETQMTPYQKSMEVIFHLAKQGLPPGENSYDINLSGTQYDLNYAITLMEPVSFNISTKWKASGGASIANKVNEVFNSNLLKMLSGNMAKNGTPTDAWTQKLTEVGSPIGMKLKFRVYHRNAKEMNNYAHVVDKDDIVTSQDEIIDYNRLIKFFTIICAPSQKFSITSNTIGAAAEAARAVAGDIKEAKEAYDNARNGGSTMITAGAASLGVLWDKIKENSGLVDIAAGPRLNYTLAFSKVGSFTFPEEIDWIVNSFEWRPSQQMTINAKTGLPEPLWVDFDVSVETNFSPSNVFISRMFCSEVSKISF